MGDCQSRTVELTACFMAEILNRPLVSGRGWKTGEIVFGWRGGAE